MTQRLSFKGGRELEKQLKYLEKKGAKNAVRKGTRVGAKVFQKQIETNVSTMLGSRAVYNKSGKLNVKQTKAEMQHMSRMLSFQSVLARSIKVGPKKKQRDGEYLMKCMIDPEATDQLIYIAKGESNYPGGRTFIPSAWEYGHDKVLWGRRTNERVEPIPIFRSAFDSKGQQSKNETIKGIQKGILTEVKKGLKK